jgi:predicted PurR-regulated permease PerM
MGECRVGALRHQRDAAVKSDAEATTSMTSPLLTPAAAASQEDPRAAMLARIYSLLRLVVAATAIILAIWLLSEVLMVVFAATLLAVILHGAANLLHRASRLPYWASLAIVTLVILAALVGLAAVAGPGLADQAVALRKALAADSKGIHDRLAQTQWGRIALRQVPASLGGEKQGGGGMPSGFAGSVAGFLGSAFGLFGTLAGVAIAGLYLAAAPGTYVNGAMRLFPVHSRAKARELALAAGHALWAWSIGQALDMLVVGMLSGVGLWLIGVPLAFVLGVIAALFNFVPYIGAIIGAIPAVVIAFSAGSHQGLETIGLYMAVQGFEGNVMAPLIQKRAVDVPPGLTILSQTAFGSILGIPGLIFATPMTAALLAVMSKATVPLQNSEKV